MSPTGISANRTPGTSTSSGPSSVAGAGVEPASFCAAASASACFAAPDLAAVFRAGAFVPGDAAPLAGRLGFSRSRKHPQPSLKPPCFQKSFQPAHSRPVISRSVAFPAAAAAAASSSMRTLAAVVGFFLASGKNRSTGREGAAPLPEALAGAELGMSAPRPRPRPRRLSLMDKSLQWKSPADPALASAIVENSNVQRFPLRLPSRRVHRWRTDRRSSQSAGNWVPPRS